MVGTYSLRERLAVGGMSEVFLASDPLGREVVIKLLSERLSTDPTFKELLRDEAALGASAAHPNVVRVLDTGGDIDPWIALERVDGVDLWRLQRALQQTQRRMEAPLACHVVREVLLGLAHVHAPRERGGAGVVHRDVSPSNVLLSLDGEVKLGDFGVALGLRMGSTGGTSGTMPPGAASRVLRGKVGYMAPEQLLGLGTDGRADLYAAGIVLAEVLTGRTLFAPGSDMGNALALRDVQVELLVETLSDHPTSLVAVVQRALARSSAERFQTAGEFHAALAPHAARAEDARPLLAALVGWARSVGRMLAGETGTDAEAPGARSSVPPSAMYESPPDPERTREVPVVTYELVTASGDPRGRFHYARLMEFAIQGALNADDVLISPEGERRRADQMPELAPHILERTATTNEGATARADWVDALPSCTYLHALARLVLAEESGVLVAEAEPARREVFLLRGRPTHLSSNLASDTLGDYLIQAGTLTRGELEMALAVLPRFDGSLPRALLHLGLLDADDLASRVDRLARERFFDLFRWRRGTLRFFRGVTPAPTAIALTLDTSDALRQGATLLDDPVARFEELMDRKLLAQSPLKGIQRTGSGPLGPEVLRHADGRNSVRAVVQAVCAERRAQARDVLRELYFLTEIGALAVRS
jgi:serine/threonine-protein kinase